MKPGKARSLIFFALLFAVAALALDASYAQQHSAGELGIGEMLGEP